MKKLLFLLFFTLQLTAQINDVGNYYFPDFATYTKARPTTTLSSGLNVVTTGNEFINTGKQIDSTAYMITITGTCTANNASHFGFGIKNGSSFSSIIYRGSNGAVEELNYNSTALKTPTWRSSGTTYAVNDVVSVRIYFDGNNLFWNVAKNGVWQQETTPIKTFVRTGELVIVIRSASTWSNIHTNIETVNNFLPFAYQNENGNDTNDGTQANPIKTVRRGKDLAKRNGVIIPSGTFNNDTTFDLRRSFTMIGDSLAPAKFYFPETRVASANFKAGSSKVYEITHPTITGTASGMCLWIENLNDVSTLIDSTEIHPLHRGRAYRCDNTKVAYLGSIALLEASNPSKAYWYQSGGKIYFTLPTGVSLTNNNLIIPSKGNNTIGNYTIGAGVKNTNVIIKNIEFSYAPMDLTNTTFELYNVKGSCNLYSTVFKFEYNTNSIFDSCEAYGSYFTTPGFGDGFSGVVGDETGPYLTDVFIKDCYAHDTADDCVTTHKNTKITVQGGLFEYAGNGITPASGALAVIDTALCRKNSMYGISCVGTPAAGMNLTEAIITSSTCSYNATNYYLYPQSGLQMNATDCFSIQGSGFHFSANVNQNNCITINN